MKFQEGVTPKCPPMPVWALGPEPGGSTPIASWLTMLGLGGGGIPGPDTPCA